MSVGCDSPVLRYNEVATIAHRSVVRPGMLLSPTKNKASGFGSWVEKISESW